MTKAEARKIAMANLSKTSSAEREWASGAIIDALTSQEVFKSAKSIFIYLNSDTEPNTEELVGLSLAMEKNVSVPKIFGGAEPNMSAGTMDTRGKNVSVPKTFGNVEQKTSDNTMNAIAITPFSDFFRNKWGILEPSKGAVVDEIDVCILPLVAFCNLARVGHGKGYYDKFLAEHECIKIGIAFDCQGVEELATEPHDIPLDMLISEKQIISSDGTSKPNFYGCMHY